jgi:hypothetical protein
MRSKKYKFGNEAVVDMSSDTNFCVVFCWNIKFSVMISVQYGRVCEFLVLRWKADIQADWE